MENGCRLHIGYVVTPLAIQSYVCVVVMNQSIQSFPFWSSELYQIMSNNLSYLCKIHRVIWQAMDRKTCTPVTNTPSYNMTNNEHFFYCIYERLRSEWGLNGVWETIHGNFHEYHCLSNDLLFKIINKCALKSNEQLFFVSSAAKSTYGFYRLPWRGESCICKHIWRTS